MSKNLTLKGAAFGALVALSISAVAPASAAGLADTSYVSLTPNGGSEYSVLLGQSFALKSNSTTAVTGTGKDLKFFIEDAASAVSVDHANSNEWTVAVDETSSSSVAGLVTIVTSTAHNLNTGDVVDVAGFTEAGYNSNDETITVIDPTTFTYNVASTFNDEVGSGTGVVTYNSGKRATNGSFVYDSHIDVNTANRILTLTSTTTATVTAKVTSWVDDNDDNIIDSTEYVSPVRTVTFIKTSEVVPTTSLSAPVVGDAVLTAKISTTPVLNGEQVDAQDNAAVFGAYFTRQDSTSTGVAAIDADSTWNDTTKLWTVTVPLAVTGGQNVEDTNWTGLRDAGATALAITEASSGIDANGEVTITSTTAHALRVGDKVTFANFSAGETDAANVALLNATHTITAVPSTTSFKFSVAKATVVVDAAFTAGAVTYAVDTYATNESITDRVFPGTYSAKAAVGATKLGSVSSLTTGASSSSKSTLSIAGTSSIQPGEFAAVADANNVEVKKATTAVPVTVAVVDSSDVAVSAGRPVVISLGAPNEGAQAGTFKINGLSAPQTLLTDAAGKVTFTVSEDDGDVAAQVRVTATPEGLSGAASSVDLIWNDSTYTLFDLNSPATSRLADRSVNKNGSYVYKFALLNQWKAAPTDGTYRLLVENSLNTVSANYVSLVAGKADVTVTDGQIGAGTSIETAVTVEKFDTTWQAQNAISWNAAGLGVITTNVKDQTDKVNLDADGATLYGNDTADLSDAVTAKTVAAQDRRTANVAQPLYGSAVTVTGNVTSSTTGAFRAGAVVTLSGASNILFSEGGLDSFGSITVIADAAGEFGVDLISAVAQKDTVITVTSNGVSSTVKVTFTGVSTDAKKLTVTSATTAYVAGQTVVFNILLTDTLGNPVNTAIKGDPATAAYITVSYEGPGIISGSLPVETDADGKASVRIVTGTADTQNAVLTVKYDQNFDGDVLDTNDLTVASTVPVLVVEPSAIVNVVGHRVYVKFNNAKGEEVSAVIGGVRYTKVATYNGYVITRWITKTGKYAVKAYVAGDLVKASTVTIK